MVAHTTGRAQGFVKAGGDQEISQIIARPRIGHAGDPIFLSGSGFPPNFRLTVFMGCPDITDPKVYQSGNFVFQQLPPTNEHGTFAGVPFGPLTLHSLQVGQDSVPCRIYTIGQYDAGKETGSGNGTIGPTLPGSYTAYIPGASLPRGSSAIKGSIRARPARVHAGVLENITVHSDWGGAAATVTIRYPHSKPMVVSKGLKVDWRGDRHLQIRVGATGIQPGQVSVSARFQQGPYRGDTRGSFVVVRK